MAPVNTPWAFFWLDVHIIQVDVHLGDIHLEAVGQQLDGFPHGAIAWPPRDGEQGCIPNGSCREKQREFPSTGVITISVGLSTSAIPTDQTAKNPELPTQEITCIITRQEMTFSPFLKIGIHHL